MTPFELITAALTAVAFGFVIVKFFLNRSREGMGGYGTLSGLYFNNNARRCFKNPYDPPDWDGMYCETIGKVVI